MSRIALVCAIWIGLIFATSCTVVSARELFDLVQYFTGADQASIERFAVFWGVSWFAVVKGWHFTEFAVLLCLVVGTIRWWRGSVTPASIVVAMMLCILFAISDEWHQSFVPNRMGTIMDVIIDSLGVCTAGGILLLRYRAKQR